MDSFSLYYHYTDPISTENHILKSGGSDFISFGYRGAKFNLFYEWKQIYHRVQNDATIANKAVRFLFFFFCVLILSLLIYLQVY